MRLNTTRYISQGSWQSAVDIEMRPSYEENASRPDAKWAALRIYDACARDLHARTRSRSRVMLHMLPVSKLRVYDRATSDCEIGYAIRFR